MARTSVTTQVAVRTGLTPALTGPVVDGDIIDSGNVGIWVVNGSGAPINVTVQATASQDGQAVEDLVVAVPAAGTRLIGPFPGRTFEQPSDAVVGAGRVLVDYSAVTTVTRGVISI